MSDYPTIKATDIRPGDKVRYERHSGGIGMVEIYTVASISDEGESVLLTVIGGAQRIIRKDMSLTLVDRPALKLPTTPGSLIWITKFTGGALVAPMLAMLDEIGEWRTPIQLPDVTHWAVPDEITAWQEATVTKPTPLTEKDPK